MKRLLTVIAMAFFMTIAAMAQIGESKSKRIETTYTTTTTTVNVKKSPSRGYSGILELDLNVGISDYASRFGFTTVHGYQINPYLFAGAGFSLKYWFDYETVSLPIFADIRATVPFGSSPIAFLGDFRLGYSAYDIYGLYFSPSVGIRIGRNKAATFALGYELIQNAEVGSAFTLLRVGFEW